VEAEEVFFASLLDAVQRPFRHEAENRHLSFEVQTDPHLARSVVTDTKRLQQVLKNLLSNAFKFTEGWGCASCRCRRPGAVGPRVTRSWARRHRWCPLRVSDTGIGIPQEKQRIIFEAFQQADAGTSRKYGGTGPGVGDQPRTGQPARRRNPAAQRSPVGASTFTLYLPQTYVGPSSSIAAPARRKNSVVPFRPCRVVSRVWPEHPVENIPRRPRQSACPRMLSC